MIKRNSNSNKKFKGQTILILVECLQGALRAGRFVLNHLYNERTRIILLQTYEVHGFGLFMMRNLSEILKETSLEDLTVLKNKLIEEFAIPPENILKVAIEGNLETALKQECYNSENMIVVIGEDTTFLKYKIPQKQISTIMKRTSIRNILYIDENVTLINNSKILSISENPERGIGVFKNYLVNLSKKYSIEIEYITSKKNNPVLLTDDTIPNISNEDSSDSEQNSTIEDILKKRLINSNVRNDNKLGYVLI